jgi:diguanylate cyclase (GGDEF)-like protein
MAQHDVLTDLPNRALLTERLSQAIGLAHRHRKQGAVMFLDLDSFKHINDSLGHDIGDRLLQLIALRLAACVRTTDTVSRQGGDEFVILLPEIEQPQDATIIAEKLLATFAEAVVIGEHELTITASIGVCIYPDDGSSAEIAMKSADTAMYHAKECGRNNYQFFRAEINARAVQRQLVEGCLRRALKHGEFLLYYQPQIDLRSNQLIGTEALVRWLDPDHGLVLPDLFIPVAEESGLIVPLGRWVLRESCRQMKAWQDRSLPGVGMSVNVSALEFRHKDFLAGLVTILKETGLDPHWLELELTESVLMRDVESSAVLLMALRNMGVGIGIDDFGTGYSSLGYLKRFPINTLKIDKTFVRNIVTDADDAMIVTAVIGMGRNLKQRIIAEGVETAEQLEFLRNQGCDGGQGYLLGRPMSAEGFAQWLLDADFLRKKD